MAGFTLDDYAALRPFLWHMTHAENIPLICQSLVLRPARSFALSANGPRRGLVRGTRGEVLRDQRPLHEANVVLGGGWSFSDFLQDLSRRVFFWSGWADRPVRSGRAAIEAYRATDRVIRVPFHDIAGQERPFFSCCNSGAPRMHDGRPAYRGPDTFLLCGDCSFPPSAVVEVTFVEAVRLPESAEIAASVGGPWVRLIGDPPVRRTRR